MQENIDSLEEAYSNIDDIYRTYTPIITSVEDDKPADDKYYDLLPGAKKLLDINPEEMDISLANDEDSVALVANIPVTNLRHGGKR